ncbi:Conserved_hypothetical protein [Hexamita inflata]|uniref:Uncharacterized protein n=1 Tax=Hexamita inflata TaxID=28002 RepID=A0AA86VHV8_9EUKA|nr:Conserved hypothetical protein [Hexamita inflata]
MYGKVTLINFMHTCILCGGNLYIQYFDSILQLFLSKLKFVVKIPDWKSYEYSSQHSRLFAIDDQLFVHNNNGSVYILQDGELTFMKSIFGRFYHFCGKSYVWNYNKQLVARLNSDLSFDKVCKTKEVYELGYQAGGLLVFDDSSKQSSYHIDMLKSETKVLPYCRKTGVINDSFEVSYVLSGITLDIEGQMRRNNAEDAFLAEQRQNKQFQNIFAFIERIIFYKMEFSNRLLKMEKEFEKTKNSKIIFTENNTKLNEMIFLNDKMVQMFVSIQEYDQ